MLKLSESLGAWGTAGFKETLKREIEQLEAGQLPLQQGLSFSSHVADSGFTVMILNVSEDPGFIHTKAGISYSGIIAGCSCADDPTPMNEQNEYCEILLSINKGTAEAEFKLLQY